METETVRLSLETYNEQPVANTKNLSWTNTIINFIRRRK